MAGPPALGAVYDAVTSAAAFLVAGGVMVVAGLVGLGLERVSPAPTTAPATPAEGERGHLPRA